MGCSKEKLCFFFAVACFLLAGCSKSADHTPLDKVPVRERVIVSGPITQDTVWERGKEYYVTRDVTVEAGVTLSLLDPSRDPAGGSGKVCA